MKGRFITLEGIDGAGKSTHLPILVEFLKHRGYSVLLTREPGGTPLGESLRELLLTRSMDSETETLLMFAARKEHLTQCILPAIEIGTWVVCDRFTDASFAYQGGGRGVALDKLTALEQWVHPDFQPDLTLLFDLPPALGKARIADGRALDRFEQEEQGFFQRVRNAYLERASQASQRIRIIDASKTQEEVHKKLQDIILTIC